MIFAFTKLMGTTPYPNCATLDALPKTKEWHQFSNTYPFSETMHFLDYLEFEGIEHKIVSLDDEFDFALFPISISFFDFSVKWFELLPLRAIELLADRKLKIWFLYSEGDNPARIKKHLDEMLEHDTNLPHDCYHFTSANTSAENLENFTYWPDDHLLFYYRNRFMNPVSYHNKVRDHKYTALVRTHKWWRATTMTKLQQISQDGYFSYNSNLCIGDRQVDNPIAIDIIEPALHYDILEFVANGPYTADNLSHFDHNSYFTQVEEHFANSYLNIVLETHFDADQSGGTFLTEKTFKPIKNAQLFVIAGPKGSVDRIRKLGYHTFDNVIDHSYDKIEDNTIRWKTLMLEIERLLTEVDLHDLYNQCANELINNQRIFTRSKKDSVNSLLEKIIPKEHYEQS